MGEVEAGEDERAGVLVGVEVVECFTLTARPWEWQKLWDFRI